MTLWGGKSLGLVMHPEDPEGIRRLRGAVLDTFSKKDERFKDIHTRYEMVHPHDRYHMEAIRYNPQSEEENNALRAATIELHNHLKANPITFKMRYAGHVPSTTPEQMTTRARSDD